MITAINDAGVAVGAIGPLKGERAALFEHGQAYDLNRLIPANSGWLLTQANAIDDSGVIVGTGYHDGVKQAFALALGAHA